MFGFRKTPGRDAARRGARSAQLLPQLAPRLAAQSTGLGVALVALRWRGEGRLPDGCVELVFDAAGRARRAAARYAGAGETACAYHPGPYETAFAPFAGAPEIGLRLRYVADAADPRVAQQRFELFLYSEGGAALTVDALNTAIAGAVRGALAQGRLDLPACTTLDEWHAFRAGLNELLYTRFGLTVDDCVPVDLGDTCDYAAMLRARVVPAGGTPATATAAPAATTTATTTGGTSAATTTTALAMARPPAEPTTTAGTTATATLAAAAATVASVTSATSAVPELTVSATAKAPASTASSTALAGAPMEAAGASTETVAASSAPSSPAPREAAPLSPSDAGNPAAHCHDAVAQPGGWRREPVLGEPLAPHAMAQARDDGTAVDAAGAGTDPATADADALRRLFLELPAWGAGVRALALPEGPALFTARRDILQRCALAALDVNTMPSLAWATPERPLAKPDQARRASHSVAAVRVLDEAWALLAQWQLATASRATAEAHATLLDEADRLTANLAFHLAGRRAVSGASWQDGERKEPQW